MNKYNNYSKYQNICILIICVWLITPTLAYSNSARFLALMATGLWLLIELIRPQGVIIKPTAPVMLLVIFFAYTAIVNIINSGLKSVITNIQLYIMLFFILVQQSQRKKPESLDLIFWIVIISSAAWLTWNYIFLSQIDARAMRTLVRSTDEATELANQGVGGYSMTYSAVLLLPALLTLSFRPEKIRLLYPPNLLMAPKYLPKFIIWYTTALSITVILSSQFSTATLTAVLCTIIVLTLWRISIPRIITAFILLIVILTFGEEILLLSLNALLPIVEGTNYTLKINDAINSINGDAYTGTANDRIERYLRSISLFFENPILGTLKYDDVGKHSTLLDNFAQWGFIFGSILFYLLSFHQFDAIRNARYKNGELSVALASLAATIATFGLNKHFGSAGIILFIVYPAIFRVIIDSTDQPRQKIKVTTYIKTPLFQRHHNNTHLIADIQDVRP